jgi:excisionase family DNA binding protein
MNQELISIKTLAERLDCSPKTIRDWMYRHRKVPMPDPLPYYRVGGLIRFRIAEVAAWIERRRVRVTSLVGPASDARALIEDVRPAGANFVELSPS